MLLTVAAGPVLTIGFQVVEIPADVDMPPIDAAA